MTSVIIKNNRSKTCRFLEDANKTNAERDAEYKVTSKKDKMSERHMLENN